MLIFKGHWKIAYARISVDYTVYVSLAYLQPSTVNETVVWIVVKKLTERIHCGLCAYSSSTLRASIILIVSMRSVCCVKKGKWKIDNGEQSKKKKEQTKEGIHIYIFIKLTRLKCRFFQVWIDRRSFAVQIIFDK